MTSGGKMAEEKEKKVDDIRKEADEKRCPVQAAIYYINGFLAGPMCGKCFPCSMGSYEAKLRLENMVSGKGTEEDLSALRKIAGAMLETSRCKKGKDTAEFILEWMEAAAFKRHVKGICDSKECVSLIEFRVIPKKCIMCGLCLDACNYNAIIGEKKASYFAGYPPFEIVRKRCVKCGDCPKVCPTGAIEIVDVESGAGVEA